MAERQKFIPLSYEKPLSGVVATRARHFYQEMNRRRTVRDFSTESVPAEVIEDFVRAASTAPSGAHRQPWTFVAVSDPGVKHQIRLAAEEEERANYGGRMPSEWLQALEPLGTDERKPFLELAPWLGRALQAELWSRTVWRAHPTLLRRGICWYRGRCVSDRRSSCRPRGLDPYTEPDGLSQGDPASARERNGMSADAGGIPGPWSRSARPTEKTDRRRFGDARVLIGSSRFTHSPTVNGTDAAVVSQKRASRPPAWSMSRNCQESWSYE